MSRRARGLLAVTTSLLLWPAGAWAASGARTAAPTLSTPTTSTPLQPPPSPTAKPKPKPKHGSLKLYLRGGFWIRGQSVTIVKRTVTLTGVVRPYVRGQSVLVKVYLAHRMIKRRRLRIIASRGRTYGHFAQAIASPGAGNLRVDVGHTRTSTLTAFGGSRRWAALQTSVGFGSTGRMVQLIQERLAALHFYIPQSGVYDNGTGLAIDAYHRLLRWGDSRQADRATIVWLLNGWGQFKVRYPRNGRHAEGNLGLQLLALVDGSRVDYIFPISSGKPSTPTILGNFRVYRRDPGYLPDGMYFSSFFIGGYAIHGYDPAPDYPASHGCMRLPIPDAITAYNWLNFGDMVDVYY